MEGRFWKTAANTVVPGEMEVAEALVGAVASGFEKKLVGLKDTLGHPLTGPGDSLDV